MARPSVRTGAAVTLVLAVATAGCGLTREAASQSDHQNAAASQSEHKNTAASQSEHKNAAASQTPGPGRGFPQAGPWASFYGPASNIDLQRLATTYRIINIDADPSAGNFTPGQIRTLKAGGRNRVISYLNLGGVERSRDYWSHAPKGLIPAGHNKKAQLGPYQGYPDELWMNPGEPEWQRLIIEYVAPRLVKQGVDGFYFDDLEVLEHGTDTTDGPCDAKCAQGALDLVGKLRARYPQLLFVMQNASGDQTLNGRTSDGKPFAGLLDGLAHEEVFTRPTDADDARDAVYSVQTDVETVKELRAWQKKGLKPGGRDFWVATEDYVNTCSNTKDAATVFSRARAEHFSTYISDKSANQNTVCYWPAQRP